jgi:hypothetical protein
LPSYCFSQFLIYFLVTLKVCDCWKCQYSCCWLCLISLMGNTKWIIVFANVRNLGTFLYRLLWPIVKSKILSEL